jgi:hypothetical protein
MMQCILTTTLRCALFVVAVLCHLCVVAALCVVAVLCVVAALFSSWTFHCSHVDGVVCCRRVVQFMNLSLCVVAVLFSSDNILMQ